MLSPFIHKITFGDHDTMVIECSGQKLMTLLNAAQNFVKEVRKHDLRPTGPSSQYVGLDRIEEIAEELEGFLILETGMNDD